MDNQDAQSVTKADRDLLDAIWLACVRAAGNGVPADDSCLQLIAAHRLASQPTSAEEAEAQFLWDQGRSRIGLPPTRLPKSRTDFRDAARSALQPGKTNP